MIHSRARCVVLFALTFNPGCSCGQPVDNDNEATARRRDRFVDVFHNNLWLSGESRSGQGSTKAGANDDRIFLRDVITERYGSKPRRQNLTIVDVPCGDMNWMPDLLASLEASFGARVNYHGYDIVPDVVASNRLRFGAAHPTWHFHEADLVARPPMRGDVLICRDLLNHLPLADAKRLLVNVIKSHSPTMVVSNNLDAGINVDVPNDGGGASRKLDIQKVPFSWPPATKGNGHLWVWSRSLLKRVRTGQAKQGGGPVR